MFFFLSRTLLNNISCHILAKNKEKNDIFWPKAWEKCNFWDFERLNFVWPKKVSFLSGTLFLVLFWTKTNKEKYIHFRPKELVNPFGNMIFLGLWNIEFFTAKKCFFSI